MRTGPDRIAVVAAWIGAVLGIASAMVSGYWALGGEGLLGTVGGEIEQWGRTRGVTVVVSLWLIVGLKLIVALAAPILAEAMPIVLPAWMSGGGPRGLGWIAAVVVAVYGLGLTMGGWLVQVGLIAAADDSDQHALRWHAYFWDPWFAIWGIAFIVALWRTRTRAGCRALPRLAAGEPGPSALRPTPN